MAVDVAFNMTNHRPTPEAIENIESLRAVFVEAGEVLQRLSPEGREQSLAITNLEQSLMWGVAAIARSNPAE